MEKIWLYLGLTLLLVGGLVHLLPETLTPIVEIGFGIFTLQRLVGLLSVIIAIFLLMKKD